MSGKTADARKGASVTSSSPQSTRNIQAYITYVKRNWTILQQSVPNMYTERTIIFNLSIPETFISLLGTKSTWCLQNSSGIKPSIPLLIAWNTIYSFFSRVMTLLTSCLLCIDGYYYHFRYRIWNLELNWIVSFKTYWLLEYRSYE